MKTMEQMGLVGRCATTKDKSIKRINSPPTSLEAAQDKVDGEE